MNIKGKEIDEIEEVEEVEDVKEVEEEAPDDRCDGSGRRTPIEFARE